MIYGNKFLTEEREISKCDIFDTIDLIESDLSQIDILFLNQYCIHEESTGSFFESIAKTIIGIVDKIINAISNIIKKIFPTVYKALQQFRLLLRDIVHDTKSGSGLKYEGSMKLTFKSLNKDGKSILDKIRGLDIVNSIKKLSGQNNLSEVEKIRDNIQSIIDEWSNFMSYTMSDLEDKYTTEESITLETADDYINADKTIGIIMDESKLIMEDLRRYLDNLASAKRNMRSENFIRFGFDNSEIKNCTKECLQSVTPTLKIYKNAIHLSEIIYRAAIKALSKISEDPDFESSYHSIPLHQNKMAFDFADFGNS